MGKVLNAMPLTFSISAAACWNPDASAPRYENFPVPVACISDENPALSGVALPTKRRLSTLSKAALLCARLCCDTEIATSVPMIFASRHGEWQREPVLLFSFARENEVSQGGFSLSVHNTAPSLFSIVHGNVATYTAIAAGAETFEAGLLETAMHLKKHHRALLVVGDEPAPREMDVCPPAQVHALLLAAGTDFSVSGTPEKHTPISADGFFRFCGIAEKFSENSADGKNLFGATIRVSRNA